jgi:hypothetical protein
MPNKPRFLEIDGDPSVNDPIIVTKRLMLIIGTIIGLCISVIIIISVIVVIVVRNEITHRIRSDKEIAKVAARVFPSKEQIDNNIIQAIHACSHNPKCRVALSNLAKPDHRHPHSSP